jgi:hypothetical protein
MTTFNSDGSPEAAPADEQLAPPPDMDPDPIADEGIAVTPEALEASVLSDDEREADYQAAKARVDAGQPSHAGDVEKLANRPSGVDAEIVEPETPGTAVALVERFDIATTDEDWPYDFLEFEGDKLGIRLPTRQALAAFSLASSKYVSLGVKNDLTGLFIARHLSPESYGRVFSRLMDPDENAYDVDTVGQLFNAIVTAAVNADKELEKGDGAK